MKITRRLLRQIILEAMYDTRTLPPKKQGIPKSMMAISDPIRKDFLSGISKSPDGGYRQAVELINTIGGTPAVIGMEGGYEAAAERGEKLRDLEFFRPIVEKDPQGLGMMGFDYYKDVFNRGPDYEGFGPVYRFQASVLGCKVDQLAYIEGSPTSPGDRGFKTFIDMGNMLEKMGIQPIPQTGQPDNFGYNQLYVVPIELSDGFKIDLKILHTDFYLDGYLTYTICG